MLRCYNRQKNCILYVNYLGKTIGSKLRCVVHKTTVAPRALFEYCSCILLSCILLICSIYNNCKIKRQKLLQCNIRVKIKNMSEALQLFQLKKELYKMFIFLYIKWSVRVI